MAKNRKGVVGSATATGVSVSELLALLPQDYLDTLALELQADKWVRKLKAATLFKLVLYSILSSERLSLREMQTNFNDPYFAALSELIHPGEVSWTGIRERLIHLNCDFARRLYHHVLEQLQQYYGKTTLEGYHIRRYDSTMIATFSHLLSGMKVGNTRAGKQQVKLTTCFEDDFSIALSFHNTQSHLSEEVALGEALKGNKAGADHVAVFDRGVQSRNTFVHMDKAGVQFVTRLSANSRYELLYTHWQDNGLSDTDSLDFVQDSAVNLYRSGAGKALQHKFRLVHYRVKGSDEELLFLTNIWDMDALFIARAYDMRWDIEVLFRFLKQEMNLTHFVCNDRNAIETMLYFTLIAAMLVLIYKQQNSIGSYKRAKKAFVRELHFDIMMDKCQDPEWVQHMKSKIQNHVKKE